ncbi:MAG TPA: hypothetical protein VGP94_12900, partial [Tepidisphaeraceae bacterium]|nr:hypothetical protein [Tepidisphaeraceae bacterium]
MHFDHVLLLLPLARVPDWLFWSVIIFGGIGAFIFVVFPFLVFLAALFETIRIPTYEPVAPDQTRPHPALDSALKNGFALIGYFTDGDKGIRRGLFSFALSPDGLMLVRIMHNRILRRIEIMTRYPDKRWLHTLSNSGMSDFSGLELRDTLMDAPFETLLQHHQSRLASMNQPPMRFLPQTAIADVKQHVN